MSHYLTNLLVLNSLLNFRTGVVLERELELLAVVPNNVAAGGVYFPELSTSDHDRLFENLRIITDKSMC